MLTYAPVKRTTFEKKKKSSDEVTSRILKWENKMYEPKRSFKQFFNELSRKFIMKKSRIGFIFSW